MTTQASYDLREFSPADRDFLAAACALFAALEEAEEFIRSHHAQEAASRLLVNPRQPEQRGPSDEDMEFYGR